MRGVVGTCQAIRELLWKTWRVKRIQGRYYTYEHTHFVQVMITHFYRFGLLELSFVLIICVSLFRYINSESFLCDCHLKWLPAWLASKKLQSNAKAVCAHPESSQGKSIFSVPAKNFVCGKIRFCFLTLETDGTKSLDLDLFNTCLYQFHLR